MYVCMNVCMCIYIYICIYICMYVCTYIHTYIHSKIICQFVVIFAPFSVGRFINIGVSKCRQFYVEYNKKYVIPCKYIYFAYIYKQVSKFRPPVK